MAIRTYKVTLDSKNTIAPEPVYLRQGDKTGAVVIDATLMDNGEPVSLDGLTPMFKANTDDGQAVIADSTGFNIVNASGGEFTYQVPNALSSVPGKIVTAYFSFSDSSGSESTFDMAFIIKKAVDITQPQAEDYITIIDGTLDSLRDQMDSLKIDLKTTLNNYNTGNFYNKSETDRKDSVTLSSAKSYTDNSLKGISSVPETFANLAAIKAKYPQGANGVMVAADNGHKYIWANNVWTDAGVYQSVGIADGTIALPMLDDQLRSNFVVISEITPQLSGVGGVNTADGKVIDFGTQSFWTHAQYNVTGNSKLYVSFGKSNNTLVPGHIFATDDNNTILASFVKGSGEIENLDNYEIMTPAGTTKLFVQSYKMPGLSVVGEVYQSLSKSIDQLKSNFVTISEITPQLSGVGGVNTADGKVIDFGTQSFWTHAQYNVTGNSKLYVSFGKSNNTLVPGHIFATDNNNKILASFVPGSGEIENFDNYEIFIPAGATKLFIQSYQNYEISVRGETYISLSDLINERTISLQQELDNKLKLSKELNNSNIYNFISRQGTLGGYPENSNKAVLNVKQNGINYVRVSVAFTSDNVPVLIHDASINRVARNLDGSAISSNINISDITLEQANTYDWGIVAGSDFKGLKTPLLSDFLKICSFKSIFPTLEFKPSTATDEQLNIIISMVNQYGLANKTFFTSVVDSILLSVININPSINIGRITHLDSISRVDNVLQFKTEFNDVRIDMFDSDTPSVDVINYASSKGVGIKVGSAYSLADIVKFASMGVTDIEVANVAFPATALNEYYDNL